MARLDVVLDRRTITRTLVWVVVAIVAVQLFRLFTDGLDLPGETLWRRLANVETENTLPTWLAAVLFLFSGLVAWMVGSAERREGGRFTRHWRLLAAIMLILSVDEIASFHEVAGGIIRSALGLSGPFYYAWVIPALVVVAVLAVVYFRFVLSLPSSIRNQVVLAAALFVGGAAGLEMLAGVFAETAARDGLGVALLATTEEVMELAGLILLLDALLAFAEERIGPVEIRLTARPRR